MKTLKLTNLIAFGAMVIINMLANLIPFGGYSSEQVSDLYPSLFTPAGITFTIWPIIYLVFGVMVVWSMIHTDEQQDKIVSRVGELFAVSCVLNIAWIFLWHFRQITLSTFAIIALMVVLYILMARTQDNRFAKAAFGLYAGWVTIASIAALYVMLVSIGWNGTDGSASVFVGMGILLAALIVGEVTYLFANYFYALAGIWAYIGIIIAQMTDYNGTHPFLILSATLGILFIAFMTGYTMYREGVFESFRNYLGKIRPVGIKKV